MRYERHEEHKREKKQRFAHFATFEGNVMTTRTQVHKVSSREARRCNQGDGDKMLWLEGVLQL